MEAAQTTERSWRSLGMIAGVLAVYALGSKIPLPGLDADKLVSVGAAEGSATRFSIMALGLMPFLTVFIFVELAKVLIPRFGQWQASSPANRAMLGRIVSVCAIILAAVQAYGVLVAMRNVGLFEADEGGLILAGIAALVGGTLLLGWLADRIVLPGLGNGFWLLWIAPSLAGFAVQVAMAIAAMRIGTAHAPNVLIGAAYVLVASAAVVLANMVIVRGGFGQGGTKLEHAGRENAAIQALIWPPLLANVVASYIAALLYVVFSLSTSAIVVSRLILLVPLMVLFVFAYARKPAGNGTADSETGTARAFPWLLLSFLQLAICVGGELLTGLLGLPWWIDGMLLIITVTVMTSLLRLLPLSRATGSVDATATA